MIRVRITKDYKQYRAGDTLEVTPNIAHGLIDSGVAVLTKDMVQSTDYHTKTVSRPEMKRGKHGRPA